MIRLNSEKIKNKKYNIVSLGYNCFPRSILTRFKLKSRKKDGELTLPFDLAVFETKEITSLIETNFENFFMNWEYVTTKQFFNFKFGYWTKEINKIKFLHETKFNENEKTILENIYKKRIENFRKIINDDTPALFVQILGDGEDVVNLFYQLKNIRGEKPFRLFVIDTKHLTQDLEYKLQDDRLNIFKPTIKADYFTYWWKKSHYNSRDGKLLEQEIISHCNMELLKLLENRNN